MALPTFNTFSFNDDNFITERIFFKGWGDRAITRAKVNRREGIKLLSTEFGQKEVTLAGIVVANSATQLQSLLDNFKKELTDEEGDLIIETGRTFKASVQNLVIQTQHYNQSVAPWEVTFVSTDPFAEGSLLSVTEVVPSGLLTFSGFVNISGTLFARPTIVFNPAGASGNTNINNMVINHIPSGQDITVSGFGAGGLDADQDVTINYDNLSVLQGSTAKDNTGSFARWEPGNNNYTITVSGIHVGGTVTLSYRPRYL